MQFFLYNYYYSLAACTWKHQVQSCHPRARFTKNPKCY